MSDELARKKRWHPKVKSGCLICRRRRVKCDETRPYCQRCIRGDFQCEGPGYGSQQFCQIIASDPQQPARPIAIGASRLQSIAVQEKLTHEIRLRSLRHVLAGGKADPFSAFCVASSSHYEQYIFDHAIHHQWSLFAPSQRPDDLAMVKQNVMSYAIHNPVSYHALLYAGACHIQFWEKSISRTTECDPELIQLKVQAIRALRDAIQQPELREVEDILIATLLLAALDGADNARRRPLRKVQARKSLTFALDAEFWCTIDVEWKHLNTFYGLLHRRGGISSMRPGAMQASAILFDILTAFLHLAAPRIPTLLPLAATLAMRTWAQNDEAPLLALGLGQGFGDVFDVLPDCAESVILQQVLRGIVDLLLDFDHIDRSKSKSFKAKADTPNERSVIWIRSMLVHELLIIPESLSTSGSLEDDLSTLVYDMCRLSCLMVCQTGIFTDNNQARRMARKLVLRLLPLLNRATVGEGTKKLCSELPDFYTWVLVLGLILAFEDFDAFNDTSCVTDVVPFLAFSAIKPQPEAWPTVHTMLSRFLWLWKDCDITGREAWNHCCRLLNTT